MAYSEYRDLTPIDNVENGDKYIEALDWAFNNKKIKNIALTGPYGAGKSSIIETFLAKDEKKKAGRFCSQEASISSSALKISMSTFLKGQAYEGETVTKIKVDANEVEKGILKQLFYKVEPRKIPQSRYRKLHQIKYVIPFFYIFVALIFVSIFIAIFMPVTRDSLIQSMRDFLPMDNPSNLVVVLAFSLLYLALSGGIAFLYCKVISKFRLKEIKLPTETTIQSGTDEADSVFNKNLDEIMYFFEATGYRTVFFEDLDRMDDPKIFVHLRELNNLLNNDDSIKKKPIVFVYAVRDDIFSKEDRTKFFDFIIPVIPVINSTNSGEILLKRLQEAKDHNIEHNISQGFVLDVAPFISDMRVLQNIYNEFVIYKETLRTTQELALSDEQMLAMIIFKNTYPKDFADIQAETGIIKAAFDSKNEFTTQRRQLIQQEIDSYSTTVECYQKEYLKNVRELKYAMFGELMGMLGTPTNLRANYRNLVSASTVMDDGYDMTQLLKQDFNTIEFYYNGANLRNCSIAKDVLKAYVDRWSEINRFCELGKEELQQRIQDLRVQQHSLSGRSISQLLDKYPLEEVLSEEEVRKNRLLVLLLRRGYIDEKYANYINYFKGTSITKDDMNFILSVKNQEPLAFDYQLTKTSMVIQRLQEFEFEEKAIYNFALLEQLMVEDDVSKLNVFIKQLSDGTKTSWKFIDEFFGRTSKPEKFIFLLSEKWSGMWAQISADETLTYDRQLDYLRMIIDVSPVSVIESQNADQCMTTFFMQHEDILQRLQDSDDERIISIIRCLDVRFRTLKTENVSATVLDMVFDEHFYELNEHMLHIIVAYKDNSLLEKLEEKPYSTLLELDYTSLTQYVYDNIEMYVRELVLSHGSLCDRSDDIIDLLVRIEGATDLQIQLLQKEQFVLDVIEDCAIDLVQDDQSKWRPVWDELLKRSIITTSWENVISYWKIYQLNDVLKAYITNHADELAILDRSVVGDKFIKEFIVADFDAEIEEKLIPVLRMDNFDLVIPGIDESALRIMVECHYFEFSANRYSDLMSVEPSIGFEFIIQNQEEYMSEKDSISMSRELFENLMLNDRVEKQYRNELFSDYADRFMTDKVALSIDSLALPITNGIFDMAWTCIEDKERAHFLCENCRILGADDLEQRFEELGGIYQNLADRTRKHSVRLELTDGYRKLAEHLEQIGYITSKEEKTESEFDPVEGRNKSRRFLTLRVKKI